MPPKSLFVGVAIGVTVMAIFVGGIVLKQRGSTPRLVGEITSVRTLGMDQTSSVAIVDFQFTNDSRLPFIVESTAMSVVDSQGNVREGDVIAASDTRRLFELFPAIGEKKADTLIIKARVEPQESRSAMLGARFDLSKAQLDARRKITVTVREVDRSVSEISQEPAAR